MKFATMLLLASSTLASSAAYARENVSADQPDRERIIVTGKRLQSESATKTVEI